MSKIRETEEAQERRASLLARKMKSSEEGREATADYAKGQAATLARTAKLRAERLVREAAPAPIVVKPTKALRKKKSA